VTAQERWLAAQWPRVRSYLPQPPTRVIELGCGRLGGFVPRLRNHGYDAIGVDPVAPEGQDYRQTEFERSDLPEPVDAVIACTSLHHVSDPDEVLDGIADELAPHGVVVVVEWDWESFDEPTARWAFERLDTSGSESWLHRHRDGWADSGEAWEGYLRGWAAHHGLHSAARLISGLDRRFERLNSLRGPYLFSELSDTSEDDERAAIEAEEIQALRLDYVGRLA
jgi:SAM-dependent methyltransferase